MPINLRRDYLGNYFQWGNHGAKYYFHDSKTESKAYDKALRQARAAYSHGYVKK
jgi:hypothetical protein